MVRSCRSTVPIVPRTVVAVAVVDGRGLVEDVGGERVRNRGRVGQVVVDAHEGEDEHHERAAGDGEPPSSTSSAATSRPCACPSGRRARRDAPRAGRTGTTRTTGTTRPTRAARANRPGTVNTGRAAARGRSTPSGRPGPRCRADRPRRARTGRAARQIAPRRTGRRRRTACPHPQPRPHPRRASSPSLCRPTSSCTRGPRGARPGPEGPGSVRPVS